MATQIALVVAGIMISFQILSRLMLVRNSQQMCTKARDEILGGELSSVDSFVGEAPQFDDLTMLAVRLNKK